MAPHGRSGGVHTISLMRTSLQIPRCGGFQAANWRHSPKVRIGRKNYACWPNDCFLIRTRTLGEAPANDRFWPKADHRERLESTHFGHSSSLSRTSAMGSQSSRPIAAISWAVDSQKGAYKNAVRQRLGLVSRTTFKQTECSLLKPTVSLSLP